MVKKRKKKKKKAAGGKQASPEQMEEQAREALTGGRYRRARSLYHKLVKLDRDRYLPGLVEASTGLCRVLVEQGKAAEANKVLEDLEALDPSAVPPALRVSLGLRRQDYEQAAIGAAQALGAGRPASGMDDPAPADALVLLFAPVGDELGLPAEIEADRVRVQAALERISQEQYREALDVLRPVGTRSPFSHWKWFAKGLCAFYRHEDETALKAFSRLPKGSVPARDAAPYRLLLEGRDALAGHAKDRGLLAESCRAAGREDLAGVLPRAEYLWRAGRIRDAYVFLRKDLDGFPSDTPGIRKSLSDLFFKGLFSLEERQAERFLGFLEESVVDGSKRPPVEKARAAGAAALYWERHAPPSPGTFEEISRFWQIFLATRTQVHGKNPRIEAAVHAHLGDYFSEEIETPEGPLAPFFSNRSSDRADLLDEERAEASYRRSLALDPDNRDTHFALLRLYEATEDSRRVNRTLDEIIKRFPHDKEALHRAGLRCVDRKAFVKGMKYLERALDLDPLDADLRETFIKACIHTAVRYLREGSRKKLLGLIPRALERTSAHSGHFIRGRAYLLARWGVMSMKAGLDREGRDLLTQALDEGGDTLRLHAFVHLLRRCERLEADVFEPSRARFEQELAGSPAVEPARDLIEVMGHALGLSNCRVELRPEHRDLIAYLSRGLEESPVPRELARVIVGRGGDEGVISPAYRDRCIRRMLEQDGEDPCFRLFRLEQDLYRGPAVLPRQEQLEEAREILRLAEQARDEELVYRARSAVSMLSKTLKRLESMRELLSMDEEDMAELEELMAEEAEYESAAFSDEEGNPEIPGEATRQTRAPEKKPKRRKPDTEQLNLFE